MTAVSVVIPWRDVACPFRAANLAHVLVEFERHAPEWEVVIAEDPTPDRFIKGEAVRVGVARASGEIVVMHDGDLLTFPRLLAAVAHVDAGAAWSMPMSHVYRLTPEASLLALGDALDFDHVNHEIALLEKPYRYVHEAGGCMVATRATLLEVPIDRRYTGYGAEDESHGMALTLLVGPPERVVGPAYHLWHPPQARESRYRLSPANEAIRRRYQRAWFKKSPKMFRDLLAESEALPGPTDLA